MKKLSEIVLKYKLKKIYLYLIMIISTYLITLFGFKYVESQLQILGVTNKIVVEKKISFGIEKRIKKINQQIKIKKQKKQALYKKTIQIKSLLKNMDLKSFGIEIGTVEADLIKGKTNVEIIIKKGESKDIASEIIWTLLGKANITIKFKEK